MWDVDNFSVLTENVETKDFSKWQAIKRIYLSELRINVAILTKHKKNSILIKPCSRGVSGALYLQSALVGVMLYRGLWLV